MKNRSRLEIVAAILETARRGAAKTRVMYTAFISFSQAQEYLSLLTDKGLIEYDREQKKYMTTAAGLEFLKICSKMNEMFDSDVL